MATAAETVRRSVTGGSKAGACAGRVGECGNGVRGRGDHGVVDSPGTDEGHTGPSPGRTGALLDWAMV